MTGTHEEWAFAQDDLGRAIEALGFPPELTEAFARQLGSPKAIRRMTAYLYAEKPDRVEDAVDEMLAICSDIETWRKKKEAEEANAAYNDLLNRGL